MAYEKKGNNGGARPGAGRKLKRDKHAGAINRAEKQIVDKLPQLIDVQERLALGGIEQIEEKWVPVTNLIMSSIDSLRKAFPNIDASNVEEILSHLVQRAQEGVDNDKLILIERKTSRTLPDRAAGQYLINRIMGTPVQKNETELNGADGEPFKVYLNVDVEKV